MVLAHERNKGAGCPFRVAPASCWRLRVLGVRLLEGSSPRPQLAGSRAARLRSNCSAALDGMAWHSSQTKTATFFGVRGSALTGFEGILRRMTCLQVINAPLYTSGFNTSSGLSKLFVIFSCPLIKLFSDQLPFFGGKVICLLWLEIIQHSALRVLLRSFCLAV